MKFLLKPIVIIFLCFLQLISIAQIQKKQIVNANPIALTRPKLVIGLVVDQMRWDYLYKFSALYSNTGFKRLLKEGFTCDNTMITHMPTFTAVGHAGIYTGSYPSIHGIVGNNWIDKMSGKYIYCVSDSTVTSVGTDNDEGKMSPRNMLANTITDELRISNNFKSKVIGISLKDRGSILPAGHSANAAYWFDDKQGNWISSSYYMKALPDWVNVFNALKQPEGFVNKEWNLLYPASSYSLSTADQQGYEGTITGEKTTTFPHLLNLDKEKKYVAFKSTPYGNTFTLDFAKTAIQNENLGKGTVPDFLTISLSSTDYIGHVFGPNSMEIEDTYLRLDNDISDFLKYLDSSYGKNNYLIFLTSDHGVAHNPEFLKQNKMPAGKFDAKEMIKEINDSLEVKFNVKNGILKYENFQLYINYNAFRDKQDTESVENISIVNYVIQLLNKKPYTLEAYYLHDLSNINIGEPIKQMSLNSYYSQRSGDVQVIPMPNYFDGNKTGTTHGDWNPYDAHIPLVWYGWNIKPGRTHHEVHMTDIASTLAALLDIQMPNGSVGKVIEEVIK